MRSWSEAFFLTLIPLTDPNHNMGRKNSKKQKQRSKGKLPSGQVVRGTLEITRSGTGFVTVEGLDADVMVRPGDFNTALHGDRVVIAIKEVRAGGRRMQGVVREVLQRKRTDFIGRVEMSRGFAFFIPETERPMPDIFIPKEAFNGATDNDRVVVRLTGWEPGGKRPMGEVISLLDEESGNDAAMKGILLEEGFPLQFTDDAAETALRISDVISAEEVARRRDVRGTLTFTIDPVDARDFDDALSIRRLMNGNYEIGVHIADVSHFLEEGSPLDQDAYLRATSVYLPDRVNPMLPEHLSNFLCSLRPLEEKLTFSAIFEMGPKGEIRDRWLGKTVIRSD
ncbi:MAG: hypothetical protein RJA57_547, partial [Bacteroidota bacterium]